MRQVHTFADAGVLVADEGTAAPGRGSHRQFPASEEKVARLLSPIVHKGMSVVEAKGVAAALRFIVRAPEDLGFRGLDQARELSCYLNACLKTDIKSGPPPAMPDPHLFMTLRSNKKKLQPRWSHVEPTENNFRRTQTWIALELAEREEADPIIFLYRGPDGTWLCELWAILTIPSDDMHEYRIGIASEQVKQIRTRETQDKPDLEFDKILIGLMANNPRHRAAGGYVIMPRRVYAKSISDSY